jgi:beta-glucuronidase
MSEFGAGALRGHDGDADTPFSEAYQVRVYEAQLEMLERIPFLCGLSPWILKDFRSPRRVLKHVQDYWSRKGLVSDKGERKRAFFVLQRFYREKADRGVSAHE